MFRFLSRLFLLFRFLVNCVVLLPTGPPTSHMGSLLCFGVWSGAWYCSPLGHLLHTWAAFSVLGFGQVRGTALLWPTYLTRGQPSLFLCLVKCVVLLSSGPPTSHVGSLHCVVFGPKRTPHQESSAVHVGPVVPAIPVEALWRPCGGFRAFCLRLFSSFSSLWPKIAKNTKIGRAAARPGGYLEVFNI